MRQAESLDHSHRKCNSRVAAPLRHSWPARSGPLAGSGVPGRVCGHSRARHQQRLLRFRSGACYAHLPHGPAPHDYDTLFAWLTGPEGALRLDEVTSGALEWEVLVANEAPDYSPFTNSELALLAQVAEKFKDATARTVSDLSHQEPGYQNTRDGEIISYAFAERMRTNPV